jgi:hypothetical protein
MGECVFFLQNLRGKKITSYIRQLRYTQSGNNIMRYNHIPLKEKLHSIAQKRESRL